jgi:hypothetical protein
MIEVLEKNVQCWDNLYNMERWYTSIACNTSQKIYIKKPKNLKKKKIISGIISEGD